MMPRNIQFNEYERGYINAAREDEKSFAEIAKYLGRSEAGVRQFFNRREYKKRSGRPPKLTPREQRRIVRLITDSTKSARDVRDECQLDVSVRTINRIVSKVPYLKRRKLKKAPKMSSVDIKLRREFARSNMNTDWKSVS